MAIVFTTDSAFTDNTLPMIKIDDILPDTQGALFLIDPSNTKDTSFINSGNGSIVNMAYEQASAIIPGATQAQLNGITVKTLSANGGLLELTSKKGIHTIVSQVNSASDQGFMISLPDKIKQYLIDHSTHGFYVSMWGRTTRISLDNTNQYSIHGITKPNTNNGRLMLTIPEGYFPSSPTLGKRIIGNDRALGNYIRTYGQNAWVGGSTPLPAAIGDFLAYFQYGSKDAYKAFNVNKSASGIFYKLYIEDLTVSGRSYEQVDAIDFALYTSAFSAGGKYYGDTFTDPATIA